MSVETPKTAGLVTLRYVVMSFLNRIKDYTMRDYYYYMQLAIEGFTELSLWHLDSLEVVYLTMNEAKIVYLPADFVDYTKIGVPINGKLRVLTRHDNILLPRTFYGSIIGGEFLPDTNFGEAVGNADDTTALDTSSLVFFSDHFRGGQFVGGLFGISGGIDEAYYRVDMETRTIAFSGSVPRSQIVLEYISSGVKTDGSTMIPREAVPALRSYIAWVEAENNPRTSESGKERKKRLHEEEVAALVSFQTIFTIDEYKRMLWQTSRQTAKR
jgi:hypothetical protein